ncbi:cytochrome c-550 PedF [Pseudosulfitobacter pseudonitzschiae]|uniref:cytochrome c-550 PedF n=1 Tax=Pseudosulfitobacter pseudonitzschiae TaxID=1402135 RepID=UPI001AF2072F|nr:cytochrome c-550 PedF [Pseudosulfitobacter pseudonitzschiae]MBM1817288.1 cytochrome c-550 PedF [Pseudosulfitobacter pseudonitzschiae]MBM1834299.1 cytochrome c-550 PedF [Pseudosulfitobacter pseudonitzschiae]MBM1839164.1 cytochrome c-550 PedF [Pseudosulfitobacter pseudonitzschiae]MBM1844013.1 cytochrome c-550 PedF [Pseudosulfitobacter pseudonitzschiae]MBM1848849.1 cytochrome c-550 PedF [Pseudosulfitobacter pseudonitzschiae]
MTSTFGKSLALGTAIATAATLALAHGDVAPQAVDTTGLPELGEEWLSENPYRADKVGDDVWLRAVEIGASGYNQNCARCHGLEVVSGGLAPDLRFLEAEEYGDEWYVERFREGYTQNGITKMPAFGELLGQEAAWAIRTYIEARPDEGALDDYADELKGLRDQIAGYAKDASGADKDALVARLSEIAAEVETASGAPVADSVAFRAANLIDGTPEGYHAAEEALTIGLSAAH